MNTYDLLKIIALLTMIIDHVGQFFYQEELWIRAIGRMAFPLFLFLVGYSHRFTLKSDIITGSLLLIAVDVWTNYPILSFNILATIIITRMCFAWAEKKGWLHYPVWQILFILIVWFPLTVPLIEYGSIAMMYALAGYYARSESADSKRRMITVLITTTLLHAVTQIYFFSFSASESVIMAVMLVLAAFCMTNVSTKPLSLKSPAMRRCIKLLARHTLLLYVLHFTAFQIVETVLHPGPVGSIWIR